jgi:hypothetical protein
MQIIGLLQNSDDDDDGDGDDDDDDDDDNSIPKLAPEL